MKNITRRFRLAQFVLLTFVLPGCASAVDDGTLSPSEEATDSTSDALKGAAANQADTALNADAADCDAAPTKGSASEAYREYASILGRSSAPIGAAGNS